MLSNVSGVTTMRIEFYKGEARSPFASGKAAAAIRKGDVVSIYGESYKVTFANYALDHDVDPRGIVNQRVQVMKI